MISRLRLFSRQHVQRARRWLRLSDSGILSDQKVWDAPTADQHGIKNQQVFCRGPRNQSLTCLAELAELGLRIRLGKGTEPDSRAPARRRERVECRRYLMGSVLVTGSTGNLGQKAVAALESAESTKVVRFGRNSANLPDVVTADLSHYGSWARSFGGVDAVLHLAADPRPVSDWAAVTKLNIDLALNVFRAAEEAQVRRIVFASSNWVVAGYRFGRERLTSCIPPRPVNPYGASKLFIERAGIALGERTGISVLALRIGWCQPGDNIPGPHMGFGRWAQEMWLSNEDWAQAVRRSCLSRYGESAVLNIVSQNEGMRWDLGAAHETIGYAPKSRHTPRLSVKVRIADAAARMRDRVIRRHCAEPLFGTRW